MRLGLLAVVVVGALGLGVWVGRASHDGGVDIRVDTVEVTPQRLLNEIESLELEADGLRSRLAGREELEPEVIYVADTIIPAPPACQLTVAIDGGGRLAVSPLIMSKDSTGSLGYRARLLDGLDVTRCDDGFSIAPNGTVVCDRPQLGHLSLVADAFMIDKSPGAFAGVEWTPYWRSAWRVRTGVRVWGDTYGWDVGLSYRFLNLW